MKMIRIALILLLCGAGCGPDKVEPSNMVLVVIDTLRADHCSCYGYFRNTTPHLDALAAEGILYENAWAQASWTCPSMVSMFTGQYVMANYLTVPQNAPVLAERLKEAGYNTAAIVANPLLYPDTGFERGFDHYEVADRVDKDTSLPAELFAEKATSLITHNLEEPFFIWLHLFDPHFPYKASADRLNTIKGITPGMTVKKYQQRQPSHATRRVEKSDCLKFEQRIARYDEEVAYADEALGKILAALESKGVSDRTLVAVTSDHGEGLYSHAFYPPGENEIKNDHFDKVGLYIYHGENVYEESIKIPLVIRGPGFPVKQRHNGLVENLDLFATFGAAAGFPLDPDSPSLDLARLGPEGKPAIFAMGQRDSSIRARSGLKLIQPTLAREGDERISKLLLISDPHPRLQPKLYDLTQDPEERKNLLPEQDETFQMLKKALSEWEQRYAFGLDDSSITPKDMMERLKGLGYVR